MINAKFKCPACGLCCTLSPVSLLPHEDITLRYLADTLELKYVSVPGYKMYDEISGYNLAFSYAMELINGKCVFLRDNLCIIHDKYKPLICRSYPFVPRQVKYYVDHNNRRVYAIVDHGLSMSCPVVLKDREKIEASGNPYKIVYDYAPSEYLASLEMERARNIYLELLSFLWKKGLVELSEAKTNAPVMNLYNFLRRFIPETPNLLNIQPIKNRV